jgi:hypothetical protein
MQHKGCEPQASLTEAGLEGGISHTDLKFTHGMAHDMSLSAYSFHRKGILML